MLEASSRSRYSGKIRKSERGQAGTQDPSPAPQIETVDALDFERFKISNERVRRHDTEPADSPGIAALQQEGITEKWTTVSSFSPLDKLVSKSRRLSKKLEGRNEQPASESEAGRWNDARKGYETVAAVPKTETMSISQPPRDGPTSYETASAIAPDRAESIEKDPESSTVAATTLNPNISPPDFPSKFKEQATAPTENSNENEPKDAVEELEEEFIEFQLTELSRCLNVGKDDGDHDWNGACELITDLLNNIRDLSKRPTIELKQALLVQAIIFIKCKRYSDALELVSDDWSKDNLPKDAMCTLLYVRSEAYLGGNNVAEAVKNCEEGINLRKKYTEEGDWPIHMCIFMNLMARIQDQSGNKMKSKFFESKVPKSWRSFEFSRGPHMISILRKGLGVRERPASNTQMPLLDKGGTNVGGDLQTTEKKIQPTPTPVPHKPSAPEMVSKEERRLKVIIAEELAGRYQQYPQGPNSYDRQGNSDKKAPTSGRATAGESLVTGFDKSLRFEPAFSVGNNPYLSNPQIAQYISEVDGRTALHYAVWREKPDVVAMLLIWGASPYVKDLEGYNPLNIAAMYAGWATSSMLLKRGGSVNVIKMMELLHQAARRGNFGFLQAWAGTVFKNPTIVNATTTHNETPLMIACYAPLVGEAVHCAEILIQNGADLNLRNDLGETALHMAARRGYMPLIERLVAYGASLSVKNKWGQVPAEVASLTAAKEAMLEWQHGSKPEIHGGTGSMA